jgi:hypothetical protein
MKNKVVHKYDGNVTTLTFPRTLRDAWPDEPNPKLEKTPHLVWLPDVLTTLACVIGWWLAIYLWSKK